MEFNIEKSSRQENNEKFVFWSSNGRIIPNLLYRFLALNGFGKYFSDHSMARRSDAVIIRITENIVSEVNVGYLLDFVRSYIEKYFEIEGDSGPVLDSLHKSTSLFGDKNLKLLNTLHINFLRDTRDTGYLFFNNGVVEVTAKGAILKPFYEFDECIWDSSIINHEFKEIDMVVLKESDFLTFISDLTITRDASSSENRFNALKSIIGYLLNNYKDGTTNRAVILMDVFVDGKPNGGSGKSLLINSIGKIRKLAVIDGKSYDQHEWFSLSSVSLDSELLLFDDVKSNFDFEQIFPLLSGGMYVRRKHKDNIHIPHDKSPKVALTTNYAINGDSSSHERRKIEFEVSSTYSHRFTPRDKFGRNFFDEWGEPDWILFYNTMIHCLTFYLSNGIQTSEPINIKKTKFVNKTCEEFAEFSYHGFPLNERLDKKILFQNFINENPDLKSKIAQREFTNWLRCWGEYSGYQTTEPRSDDVRYIVFYQASES